MPVLLNARGYDTDKNSQYLRHYARYFGGLVERPVRLLELGVGKGGSLRLWRDYFPNGLIVGLDSEPSALHELDGRIHVYRGVQQDTALLDRIAHEQAPDGFDIVIDDASHIGWQSWRSFWHLFSRHLKPGGVFAIEDWGTGYWEDWPDGRCADIGDTGTEDVREWSSHTAGMVGFVKTLVDEVGVSDMSCRRSSGWPARSSLIERLEFLPGQVFAVRSAVRAET